MADDKVSKTLESIASVACMHVANKGQQMHTLGKSQSAWRVLLQAFLISYVYQQTVRAPTST